MSKRNARKGRAATALKAGAIALVVAGSAAFGFRSHLVPLAAQSSAPDAQEATASLAEQSVTLYKNPNCTCCGRWGDHLREGGFTVRQEPRDDVQAMMDEHGVPMHLRSCHIGVVGDYVLVGHVPADLAVRLLEERPAVTGIAVPGMPLGSPGMEGLGRTQGYTVSAFGPDGLEYAFASR